MWFYTNFQREDLCTIYKTTAHLNRHFSLNKEKTDLTYYARPPVKMIKIFEKVKGAIISGKVAKNIRNNTPVNITLKLKTKFNRIFTYKQTTAINEGKYKFIVPYPTTLMRGDGYDYDIEPIDKYLIQIGKSRTISVSVSEEEVISGKEITIDNLADKPN